MREQTLFHAGDKHTVELQSFAGVHRHELNRVLPGLRLVIASLQRRMGQKRSQW